MDHGQHRRSFVRSHRIVSNSESEHHSIPLETSHASQNTQSSRRAEMNKNIKYEHGNFVGAQHKEEGKFTCPEYIPLIPAAYGDDAIMNLTEQTRKDKLPEIPPPFSALRNQLAEEIRKGKTAEVSSLCCNPQFSNSSKRSWKGKEKADSNTCEDTGKEIGFSHNSQQTEKRVPAFLHSVALPRVTGQRRLVRNGCISPHNISTRAKQQSAESRSQNPKDVEHSHLLDMVSNGPPCVSGIHEIVAEERDFSRPKRKSALSQPSTSNRHDTVKLQFPISRMNKKVEANGTSDANGDANRCLKGLGGWRSKSNWLGNNAAGQVSRRNDASNPQCENSLEIVDDTTGKNILSKSDLHADRSLTQTHVRASQTLSHLGQRQPQAPISITKRQRKHETSRNWGECSTSASENSESICRGQSRDSQTHTFGFGRAHGPQNVSPFNQVIEIDKVSPEVRQNGSRTMIGTNNDHPDSRATQLLADEILARELQEQLYNEVLVGGGETDEHLALALQLEEDETHASSSSRDISLPDEHLSSQPPLLFSRNPSTTRGTQARVRNRSRLSRLRNRYSGRSTATASGQRNLQLPRLDILEALEPTFREGVRRGRRVLQVQRDFNEDDYEMLLALDENNHRAGTSGNQINSLPVSTVQTENLDECAVCLEAPTIGDSICHLPCLHKFHKDCIHPWLQRSRSCPVCKSSVT